MFDRQADSFLAQTCAMLAILLVMYALGVDGGSDLAALHLAAAG